MQCRLRQRRLKWIAGSDRKESLIAVGNKLYHGLIRFSFIFHLIFVVIWTPWVILILFIRSKIKLLHYPYPYNYFSQLHTLYFHEEKFWRRDGWWTPDSLYDRTGKRNHVLKIRLSVTGCRPPPPSSTGIGERCSQTISKLGHAALLRRCELLL
jgi:hypothetical protein